MNIWIIGQAAETQSQSEVPSEPVNQDQTSTGTVTNSEPNTMQKAPAPSSSYMQLLFIVGIFVIMYFILFREPRKRQRQQQQMIQTLKKNDKVRTIGGIIGTIVDVRGDEVLIKVDENNNTKIWFAASSIGKNLTNETK